MNRADTLGGLADMMLPPGYEPPIGPQPVVPRRPSAADAYRMGQLAGMEDYNEVDPRSAYRGYDKHRAALQRLEAAPDLGGPLIPSGPQVSAGHPEVNRAVDVASELGAGVVIPQSGSPLDIGLAVAGGPVGGKLLRGGAAALGALFEPDEAEAGVISRVGKVLGGRPGGPHPGGIHVYHSSPHDFDKFDWSKLRTGEGANVYGSGFYFAENPAVSGQGGQYWDQFARNRFAYDPTPEGMATRALMETKADRAAAIAKLSDPKYQEHLKHFLPNSYFKNVEPRDALRLLESGAPVGPRTYEVNINARPELMLDWDKPWQAQPKLVQEVARASGVHPESPGPMGTRVMSDSPMGEVAGRNLKDPNSLMIRNMQEAGIPGIRYLDQGSRNVGDWHLTPPSQTVSGKWMVKSNDYNSKGLHFDTEEAARTALAEKQGHRSYNYVVTDPSKLDILAKYSVVGGAPLGVLAAQDRYQQ